jgi:hypothetical protein
MRHVYILSGIAEFASGKLSEAFVVKNKPTTDSDLSPTEAKPALQAEA